MGLSRHFRSMVRTPGPNDPVEVNRQGNTTSMEFGLDAQEAFGQLPAPVTQSERGAEALLKAMGRIPDMPRDLMPMNSQQRQKIGYEPSMSIGDLRMMDEQAMSAKSPDTYGTNRGGTGNAGRGTQFGKSQFDVAQQFMDKPEQIDDKPWELDDNTNADVQPGVSLTPKPEENVVDKEPDLQSPRGLYQALAKKYPDILTQNLDQLQKSRVTEEDLEGLSDRAGLGSLFIAASKAASGAGSIGGKTAESIAPTIVNREDILARQRLKDRMDVASENMQMNAKAVDLAMKQIDFADEREQYDPNSDVSQFARDFMKQEFDVNVPNNVPAYQLKQFLPAVVQKYQAQERASYQSALLGQKTADSLLNDAYRRYQTAIQSGDKQAQIEAEKYIARLKTMAKGPGEGKTPKPVLSEAEKIRNDLVKDDAKVYQKRLQGLQKLDGALQIITKTKDQAEIVRQGQSLLKTLNDTENSDAVGAEEVKRLASELQNFAVMTPDKWIQIGRDLPGFIDRVKTLRDRLYNTAKLQYDAINKKMPDVVDAPPTYEALTGEAPATLPSGKKPLTPAERKRLEQLRNEGAK